MNSDVAEVVQILGPELDAFLTRAGIELPPGMTGEMFMRELFDGGPGIPADRSFFARLGVSLMHSGLQNEQNFAELSQLIQERLAARRAAANNK